MVTEQTQLQRRLPIAEARRRFSPAFRLSGHAGDGLGLDGQLDIRKTERYYMKGQKDEQY